MSRSMTRSATVLAMMDSPHVVVRVLATKAARNPLHMARA
jgi:hypothetical protein